MEEQSLRRATRETVTVTELHLLDAVAQDEQATISSLALSLIHISTIPLGLRPRIVSR